MMTTRHRQIRSVGPATVDEITASRVPMPTLLNPGRQVVNSHGGNFVDHDRQNLKPALERPISDLCAYGQQLWNDGNTMRADLLHRQATAGLPDPESA